MANRDPFEVRAVVSRRGGPAKPPLSRDAIVDEALVQLARDGLDAMSLRKVAAALETGAASLYVYVKDLDELQTLVFDRALAKVSLRGGKQKDWRERVKALLQAYLKVLLATPGLAQLAFRRAAVGPNSLRFVDALLGEFASAGAELRAAAWAVDMLLLYVTALGAERGQRSDGAHERAAAHALGAVSAADYPHLHAARAELASAPEQRVGWAIDSILNGVVPAHRPAKRSTQRTR